MPPGPARAPRPGRGPAIYVPGPKKPERDEIERFKTSEELKGNEVRELRDGTLIVSPAPNRNRAPAAVP
jgi:hypothetical protein